MDQEQENYEYSGRAAPQAVEAEVFFLGGVMQDPNVLSDVVSLLDPEDFFQERHKIIWEALQRLSQFNTPIDVVTLSNALETDNKLEAAGGREYLLKLIESVASGANARYHAEIIQKKAVMRRLINVSTTAIPASEVVQEILKAVEMRKDGFSGCPTGFTDLDRLTNGLQPSDLIILAGRPGMGKSAFALTLAANSSVNYGKHVAFFSLEMGAEQLMQRIICSLAGIELSKFRSGHLNQDEFAKLPGAASRIMQSNTLYVDDNLDLGIMELLSKCRSLKRKVGLDLVIVDYLQLMKTGKEENRAVAVGAISRGLKVLAKDLKIPVIALAQLSRKTEERADAARSIKARPQLSDLRESGSIEQDADMVWFIERPFYRSHDEADKNKAQLLVAKHRNGATADIDLTWIPQYTRFDNYIPEEEAGPDGGMGFGSVDDIGI